MSETTEFKFSPLQEKWLQALESDNYQQTVRCLFDGEGYCCLGVACAILGYEKSTTLSGTFIGPNEELIGGYLNGYTWRLLGLHSEHGMFLQAVEYQGKLNRSLSRLNDNGMPFPELAALIRANPRNVFVEPSPCSPQ